jgi:alpha-amylase
MKTLCIYFQVHQPFRLKNYRFFEIGNDHYYYDDYANKSIMRKIAERCYLPMNKILLDVIKEFGKRFKISFSISGSAIEQFEKYAPEVIESFQQLAKTGSVEFLAETYSHSLSALKSQDEFSRQVQKHSEKINELFGQTPKVFRNTELVYSDRIGEMIAEMGYKAILTEGAKHILGWKSPNYLYYNALNPKLKVLLRNYVLSDDIAFRFSNKFWKEYPLTAEKYVTWLNEVPENEEIVNLFMDYETFGEHQNAQTGIFDFMKVLPAAIFKGTQYKFMTPTEVAEKLQPVAAVHVPFPISWADEERDLTAWLGNEMQDETFDKLYELEPLVSKIEDPQIQRDWRLLQTSDHFYYMCTKFFSDGDVHMYFNPYKNPYNAFINYMNVLSDFIIRVKNVAHTIVGVQEPKTQEEIEAVIKNYQTEIERLKSKLQATKPLAEKTVTKTISKKEVEETNVGTKKVEKKEKPVKKETVKKVTKKKDKE